MLRTQIVDMPCGFVYTARRKKVMLNVRSAEVTQIDGTACRQDSCNFGAMINLGGDLADLGLSRKKNPEITVTKGVF